MKQATTHLLAALALGSAGLAFAQGNPPTTEPPNPATAAGQQNPTGGPMGTTGTQVQNTTPGMAPAPAPAAAPPADTSAQAPADPMRPARADRN